VLRAGTKPVGNLPKEPTQESWELYVHREFTRTRWIEWRLVSYQAKEESESERSKKEKERKKLNTLSGNGAI